MKITIEREKIVAFQIIAFAEEINILDFLDSGRELLGNYFLVNMGKYYHGHKEGFDQCFKITEELLKDERWMEIDFIIHHNIRVGIPKR